MSAIEWLLCAGLSLLADLHGPCMLGNYTTLLCYILYTGEYTALEYIVYCIRMRARQGIYGRINSFPWRGIFDRITRVESSYGQYIILIIIRLMITLSISLCTVFVYCEIYPLLESITVSVLWREEGYMMKYSLRLSLRLSARGISRGLRLYFTVNPNLNHMPDIFNFEKVY